MIVDLPGFVIDLMSTAQIKLAPKSPQFLKVAEVADMLRKKPKTIYEWVEKGLIPHRKVCGSLLFDLDEIIRWMKQDARG